MIHPAKSVVAASLGLELDDFESDRPWLAAGAKIEAVAGDGWIEGVTFSPLIPHSDARGSLFELLTTRDGTIEPIVHVYQVTALSGSIRAWVYHRRQYDRLAFANGHFRIVLYDIRPNSRTLNLLNVFILGCEQPGLLRVPPFVIHGVQNIGSATATFVNMPTQAYDPANPDKSRLPENDPRIPFSFDIGQVS
ncbi:MAG: dTDP-4-dehydrorhamnose 3,5-epimerase family protein [Bradyrhizobium sp.]